MPEGPTILLMKEDLLKLEGKTVTNAKGSIISDKNIVVGEALKEVRTFGKLTFLVFEKFSFRIHLLMYGSYSLFEKKHLSHTLRLGLQFKNEEVYFYTRYLLFICIVCRSSDEKNNRKSNIRRRWRYLTGRSSHSNWYKYRDSYRC